MDDAVLLVDSVIVLKDLLVQTVHKDYVPFREHGQIKRLGSITLTIMLSVQIWEFVIVQLDFVLVGRVLKALRAKDNHAPRNATVLVNVNRCSIML
jgi:hypothetical protein